MSNPMDYEVGEIVRVTTPPVRIARPQTATSVTVRTESGVSYVMPPGSTVERADPEWWPPRPGDLLKTPAGVRLFAVARGSNIWLISGYHGDDEVSPQEAWEQRHLLTLVDREDEQDGGA
jgi:hypothetical protein